MYISDKDKVCKCIGREENRYLGTDLDCIPSSVCIIKNDRDFSIKRCNKAFLSLFAIDKEILNQKYANKLGALLDIESVKELSRIVQKLAKCKPIKLHQKIKRDNQVGHIHTELLLMEDRTEIICISFDITDYENKKLIFSEYESIFDFIKKEKKVDTFIYENKTDTAILYGYSSFLEEVADKKSNICENFSDKLVNCKKVQDNYRKNIRDQFDSISKDKPQLFCEFEVNDEKQEVKWIKMTLKYQETKNSKKAVTIGVLEDITREKEVSHNYLNETQFYQAILTEKDAFAHIDVTEDRITKIGGIWNLYNEIINKVTYTELITEFIYKVVHPDDRKHYFECMERKNFLSSFDCGINRLSCEFRRIVSQNKMEWMKIDIHIFSDPLTNHIFGLLYIKNVDAEKKQELSIQRELYYDHLTNVYNKVSAKKAIEDYITISNSEQMNALIILDIEKFRNINRQYGYSYGDEILIKFAKSLSEYFRKSDIVSRFCNDKFVIFLKNITSKQWLNNRLDDLINTLKEDLKFKDINLRIGIVIFSEKGSYNNFYTKADKALYMSKKYSLNYYYFDENDDINKEGYFTQNETSIDFEKTILDFDEEYINIEEHSFDSFLSEYGDIAYLVDPNSFELLYGNKAFYNRIGLIAEECIGKKCYELMHKRTSPCPFCSKSNWNTEKFYIWKNMNMVFEQEFIMKNKLVNWNGEEMMFALAIDISNDKSIVDSLDNEAAQEHVLLSCVHNISTALTKEIAMERALEGAGTFFGSNNVYFWEKTEENGIYECTACWGDNNDVGCYKEIATDVNRWLNSKKWHNQVIIENPESMLMHSYEMYKCMVDKNVKNQRWIQVKEDDDEYGYICVCNVNCNFQNRAFLESLEVFMAGELKKHKLIEKSKYTQYHDELTKLRNRKSFEEYLNNYNSDDKFHLGVAIANISKLKEINKLRGYFTGNFYIKQFAEMIESVFATDYIFRLNGDEFLIISDDKEREEWETSVGKLLEAVEDNGYFSAHIGYSWDDIEKDINTLIEQATQSLGVERKINQDIDGNSENDERGKMLSGVIQAIEKGLFEIVLQPKVDLISKEVRGAEALIRYRDPKRGLIGPTSFIETLEKTSLIRYIDLFVFEEVCQNLEVWNLENRTLPVVSLNFSKTTLQERNIVKTISSIIDKYNISREYIEIEITESASSIGKGAFYKVAQEISEAGFLISLDDFGTKYTNISILADIKFSVLKLDKSLITKIEKEQKHQIIAQNIIHMCNDLGIKVIAEGVETVQQEKILEKLNCNMAQGYLYSKPLSISEYEELFM